MRGKVGEVVVLWMRRWEEPEAEMRVLGVGAKEKISVGWAGGACVSRDAISRGWWTERRC